MEIKINFSKEKFKGAFAIIKKVYYIILPLVVIGMIIALYSLNKEQKRLGNNYTNDILEGECAAYSLSAIGKKRYSYFKNYSYTIIIYKYESTQDGAILYCSLSNHYSIVRSFLQLTPTIKIIDYKQDETLYKGDTIEFEYDKTKNIYYSIKLYNIYPGQSAHFTLHVTSKMLDELKNSIKKRCESGDLDKCHSVLAAIRFCIDDEKI